MKIDKLKLKNFGQFTDFEIQYNGTITKLVGVNGSGKSTVGETSIWAALKGIAQKNSDGQLIGDRFRFIGSKGASASVELTLIDEKRDNARVQIKNIITKAGNNISFTADEGYKISGDWLQNLISVAFLSAKNFCGLDSKKQALLLGIDVSDYDRKTAELKNEYTLINHERKAKGVPVKVPKVEQVSLDSLMQDRKKAEDHNNEIYRYDRDKKQHQEQIVRYEEEVARLEQELKGSRVLLEQAKRNLSGLKDPGQPMDLGSIDEKIRDSEKINQQARDYARYLGDLKTIDELDLKLNDNKEKQKKVDEAKTAYIQSFDFGFKGLGVDENGGLTLNDRPIKEPYFSQAEREIIVAKLYASMNPEFKYRFIDDFDLLDESNAEKLLKDLLDDGFQVVVAQVGKEVKGDNTILLKECRVVEDYNEEKKEALL